jgi:hypothetical protein
MTTAVKENGILFQGPMVRAILDDKKTQTRRILDRVKGFGKVLHFGESNTPGYDYHFRCRRGLWQDFRKQELIDRCPYGRVGDRLWVRESHAIYTDAFTREKGDEVVLYRADSSAYWNMTPYAHIEAEFNPLRDTSDYEPKWTPSIHMPKWASRLSLEIVRVGVERLQDISEADAYAEGVTIPDHYKFASNGRPEDRNEARVTYESLWESINGPGSWDLNPFVWVVEFKKISP